MTDYALDLNDELTKQAICNLGYVDQDLVKKSKDDVMKETSIPKEFRNDRDYFI